MILGLAKNPQSGRACAPGGSAPPGSWRPPALGTGCGVFACHRTGGPLWAERPIPALWVSPERRRVGVDQARRGRIRQVQSLGEPPLLSLLIGLSKRKAKNYITFV